MAHPASRVLALLELLQAHHRLTGPELADRLGVDERTVRRYASTLAELDIPVVAARGRYGGYRLRPGFKLPPLMLSDDEAVAVVLGLVAADRIGLGAQTPAAAAAQAKITRVLPESLARRLAALQESLGFTLPRREGTARPATATLLDLGTATREHRRIDLTYRSGRRPVTAVPEPARGSKAAASPPASTAADAAGPGASARPAAAAAADGDGLSRRDVDPYGLVFHAGRWYLAGLDHLSNDIRTFRVDRIVAFTVRAVRFAPPPAFDAVAHVSRSLAGAPWSHEVEVLLEADLALARRRVPATVAELSETADGVLLRANVQSLPGMAQLLAGLGWPFTVLRPEPLRDAVAQLAGRLAGYAERVPQDDRER